MAASFLCPLSSLPPRPSNRSPLRLSRRSNTLLLASCSSIPHLTSRTRRIGIRRSSPFLIRFLASSSSASPNGGAERASMAGAAKWAEWIPRGFVGVGDAGPENILRLISGAAFSPICQFVDSPRTFLHSADPRVKLVWLLALVILPARSHFYMRFGLVLYLTLMSIWILPEHVWKDQLGRVALLSGIVFIMLGFGSDGVPPLAQTRTPCVVGLPNLPFSLGGYSYTIMKLGPLEFTRKGLSVASTSACLSFVVFQSASLCLTTTSPEQLASALWWFLIPLRHIGVPVAELILTLLLSLRFINLVFDEVRNAALGIVARRINWKQLSAIETIDIFFVYVRRIFKNIFDHSEQISKAMIARGFRGDSSHHKIYFLVESSLRIVDILLLICLCFLVGLATFSERLV